MKKLFMILMAAMLPMLIQAREVLTIEGPEDEYNQIKVINHTSVENLRCRVVKINDADDTNPIVYGIYELKGYEDSDVNTNWIKSGSKIGVEFPGDLNIDIDCKVEYKDLPLFDIVIIHLFDKKSQGSSEWK